MNSLKLPIVLIATAFVLIAFFSVQTESVPVQGFAASYVSGSKNTIDHSLGFEIVLFIFFLFGIFLFRSMFASLRLEWN